MDIELQVLYDTVTIQNRNKELAAQIDKYAHDNQISELVLLVVLKGAAMFAMDLSRHIRTLHSWEFIRAKSYIGEQSGRMHSSGQVQISESADIKGKDVIVIEDIVDTGLTMKHMMEKLKADGAKSIRVCTLLDKPVSRIHEVQVDFVGFTLEGAPFIIGYGLDLDEKLRNIPFIGFKK